MRYFNMTRTHLGVTELYRSDYKEDAAFEELAFWEGRSADVNSPETYALIEVPHELTPEVLQARKLAAERLPRQSDRWVALAKLGAEREAFDRSCGVTWYYGDERPDGDRDRPDADDVRQAQGSDAPGDLGD